jgi:hypothetical protein
LPGVEEPPPHGDQTLVGAAAVASRGYRSYSDKVVGPDPETVSRSIGIKSTTFR